MFHSKDQSIDEFLGRPQARNPEADVLKSSVSVEPTRTPPRQVMVMLDSSDLYGLLDMYSQLKQNRKVWVMVDQLKIIGHQVTEPTESGCWGFIHPRESSMVIKILSLLEHGQLPVIVFEPGKHLHLYELKEIPHDQYSIL